MMHLVQYQVTDIVIKYLFIYLFSTFISFSSTDFEFQNMAEQNDSLPTFAEHSISMR